MPWPSVPDALTVEPSRFARRAWDDQLVLQSTVELSLLWFLTEPRYSGESGAAEHSRRLAFGDDNGKSVDAGIAEYFRALALLMLLATDARVTGEVANLNPSSSLCSQLGGVSVDSPMPLPWKRAPLKCHRAQAPGQAPGAQAFGQALQRVSKALVDSPMPLPWRKLHRSVAVGK